ncbi:MAG: 30S ribosomal protein S9, partial [Patescibacteria group bacterium]
MAKVVKKDYIYAVGRRRTSSARVRLFKGDGQSLVNDQPIGQYFPGDISRSLWMKPFELSELTGKYFVSVKVTGGGRVGQLGATILGIARTI